MKDHWPIMVADGLSSVFVRQFWKVLTAGVGTLGAFEAQFVLAQNCQPRSTHWPISKCVLSLPRPESWILPNYGAIIDGRHWGCSSTQTKHMPRVQESCFRPQRTGRVRLFTTPVTFSGSHLMCYSLVILIRYFPVHCFEKKPHFVFFFWRICYLGGRDSWFDFGHDAFLRASGV